MSYYSLDEIGSFCSWPSSKGNGFCSSYDCLMKVSSYWPGWGFWRWCYRYIWYWWCWWWWNWRPLGIHSVSEVVTQTLCSTMIIKIRTLFMCWWWWCQRWWTLSTTRRSPCCYGIEPTTVPALCRRRRSCALIWPTWCHWGWRWWHWGLLDLGNSHDQSVAWRAVWSTCLPSCWKWRRETRGHLQIISLSEGIQWILYGIHKSKCIIQIHSCVS